ncbi:hypothetical protein SETIT_2G194700v2 [Setaria italica]|uniref:indole-3-glycerol-phosphate synthase n=1 Tax=Setaria italica TaxID=4555 RepID=A0A368Q0J2_SETIT|nr:hypothetical protein SETIT_2G194700v2 [Setaria italica]
MSGSRDWENEGRATPCSLHPLESVKGGPLPSSPRRSWRRGAGGRSSGIRRSRSRSGRPGRRSTGWLSPRSVRRFPGTLPRPPQRRAPRARRRGQEGVAHQGLRNHFNPVEITQAYEKNGAACLSILTDEKHFLGSFKNMKTIHNSGVNFPLLCKDFIIDIWQIYYARSKGADAILLIAAVLPDLDIKYMLRVCRSLGMTALVEVHDVRELDHVLKIDGVQPIGINNCSLGTFEVDTTNTNMLLEKRGDIIRKKKIMSLLIQNLESYPLMTTERFNCSGKAPKTPNLRRKVLLLISLEEVAI